MNQVAVMKPVEVGRVPAGLNDKLVWLTRFGKPGVSYLRKGWWARLQMHVVAKGTTFEIDSESDHTSPEKAVEELIERLLATLKDLGADR